MDLEVGRAELERMIEMHKQLWVVLMGILSLALAQDGRKFPVDPQTGRAIGAKEISPEDLKKYIDKKTKSLIIDVRDPDAFSKQTIKGAINIPLDQLEAKLKGIPKDTALFFT
jgi:3-mercaptopyruvate sulfurtransferase SseA